MLTLNRLHDLLRTRTRFQTHASLFVSDGFRKKSRKRFLGDNSEAGLLLALPLQRSVFPSSGSPSVAKVSPSGATQHFFVSFFFYSES